MNAVDTIARAGRARIPARLYTCASPEPRTDDDGVLVVHTVLQAIALVRAVHDHPDRIQLLIEDRAALLQQTHTWWQHHRQIGMPAACPLPQWLDDLPPLDPAPGGSTQRPLALHIPDAPTRERGALLAPPALWTQIMNAHLETR